MKSHLEGKSVVRIFIMIQLVLKMRRHHEWNTLCNILQHTATHCNNQVAENGVESVVE